MKDYEDLMSGTIRLTYYDQNSQSEGGNQSGKRSNQDFMVSIFSTESDMKAVSETVKADLLPEQTVGIKSNSLNSQYEHNIFLEWDTKNVAIEQIQRELNGTLIETVRGFHLIKPAQIGLKELLLLQDKYGCCVGFQNYTRLRGHATLRVAFKLGSYLHILENGDPSSLLDWYLSLHHNLSGFNPATKNDHSGMQVFGSIF